MERNTFVYQLNSKKGKKEKGPQNKGKKKVGKARTFTIGKNRCWCINIAWEGTKRKLEGGVNFGGKS